ncbi:MAG TPA: flagellar biosynthesis anti-sigma factor FlgM [Gammaproteobacteria bacterium]|nr:flagellar biosynthesis anti-sigma factor FlgM [Gammaproteobacteria bacterium]
MEIDDNRVTSLASFAAGTAATGNEQERNPPRASENSATAGDRVSLTDTARQLQALEARVASEPVVNRERVETVRSAVENGSFTINPERIADKLLSLEQALTDMR